MSMIKLDLTFSRGRLFPHVMRKTCPTRTSVSKGQGQDRDQYEIVGLVISEFVFRFSDFGTWKTALPDAETGPAGTTGEIWGAGNECHL